MPSFIYYNLLFHYHFTLGMGLPSNVAFSSSGSPSPTSAERGSAFKNDGGICVILSLAELWASPAMFTAFTVY